jgi:hypothetical protein
LFEPDETAPADAPVEVPPRLALEDRPEDPPPAADPPVEFVAEFDEFTLFAVPATDVGLVLVTLDVVAAPIGVVLVDGLAPELMVGSTTALPRVSEPLG